MHLKCLKTVHYYFEMLPHELIKIATNKNKTKNTQSNGFHTLN